MVTSIFRPSELSALSDLTDIEYPCIRYAASRESLLEQLRRLEHIFLCQHPSSPMYTHGSLAFCVLKNVDTIKRVRMHRRHNPAGILNKDLGVSIDVSTKTDTPSSIISESTGPKDDSRAILSLRGGNLESENTYVSANGNEAKVERSSKGTNVFEGWAMWVDVIFIVVIHTFR